MAKKSKSVDIAAQNSIAGDDSTVVVDVNLATQANADETKAADTQSKDSNNEKAEAPTEAPTEKPAETPSSSNHKELSKSLFEATGIRGYDIDEMLSQCKTAEDKKAAYDKVLWHVGRIHSCGDSTHLMHQGRFAQDGTDSKLVKDLKTAFEQ